ncbi:hypothetical protein PISMIDRAFT_438380 [Pisolithus microcarpus 441]|uniref:Uncharacterized protein n=1 Tax=Pisolithus microcarpus 441 TaxID=765257 RepID=A0A0D0A5J1_9AGAM|nr:hypothetical protein PISMIDRAFT_438380 [Pisolithus microcarpus 441]
MPWPAEVICQFQVIPLTSSDNDFQGAYNKLLNTLFPPDTDFIVVPQYLEPSSLVSSSPLKSFSEESLFLFWSRRHPPSSPTDRRANWQMR